MARAFVYVFLCCCGMFTFYTGLPYLLHQMNGDTVIGMGIGFLLSLALMRAIKWLEDRGAGWFTEQGGKVPAKRS